MTSTAPDPKPANEFASIDAPQRKLTLVNRLWRQMPAVVALAVGLVVSALLFYLTTRFEQRRTLSAFEAQVAGLEVPLQRGLAGDLVVLGSIARLYAASDAVDREEFREFLRDTWVNHPGIQLLAWAPQVDPADVATYERRAVHDFKTHRSFRIRPPGAPAAATAPSTGPSTDPAAAAPALATDRPLFPLQFVQPARRREALLGIDLAAIPACRVAMEQAAFRNVAFATPPLVLPDGAAVDCVVFQPISIKRPDPAGPDAPDADAPGPGPRGAARTTRPSASRPARRQLDGFAVGVLGLEPLLRPVLKDVDRNAANVDVALLDMTGPGAAFQLFPTRGAPPADVAALAARATATARGEVSDEARLRRASAIDVAGRTWVLVFTASPKFVAGRSLGLRWAALAGSLLFTALATAYLVALGGRAARITSVVASRTAELREANAELVGLVVAREQTEEKLRKSEAVYHSLVETLPQNIFRKDLSGQFTFGNTNFGRELKTDPERIVGKTDHDFFPKDLADRYVDDDRRVIETGRALQTVEEHVAPGGNKVYVEVIKTPVVANDGKIIGTQGIFWDVTAREEAKRLLHEKNRQLEEAARAEREVREALQKAQATLVQSEKLAGLGQMVAGVAHEINNPLAFVSNNVAVLQRDLRAMVDLLKLYQQADPLLGERDPALARAIKDLIERMDLGYTIDNVDDLLARSRDGLKRIQQIVKDLREFARLDRSDYQDADLNAGVESTINIIRGHAKKKQVQIETALGPLPPVRCFPAKVNQVIMNLLTNAIDASPERGTVRVRTTAADGVAQIQVSDAGSGIPADIRERIFDPFFTTKPPGQGTGLGLSISYGIIQDHGGRIGVTSEVGKGSVFTVELPVAGDEKVTR